MNTIATSHAIGMPLDRVDGPVKVTGAARYAFEAPVDRPVYLYPLQAEIAAGRITGVDASAARAEPGVLAVLTHENVPPLAWASDPEIAVLYSDQVAFRGQLVGAVVAETSEIARHAAGLVMLDYQERAHDVVLRYDRDDLHKPVNTAYFGAGGGELLTGMPADTALGDVEDGLASAAVRLDATYTTPMCHQNPMEPHAAVATWTDGMLRVYCSTQGATRTAGLIARALGLDQQRVRVIAPHVGGAFGSKLYPTAYAVLAAMAAQAVAGRSVKFSLTRQQMFSLAGYRGPTIQRIRLGADTGGHLTAIAHDAIGQHAAIKEYAENVATCTRMMYAAPNRRTTHRLAALDVPPPTIMRAPGEAQGMFALESAMDEMAIACGLDPVEFRIRNEPAVHPESGLPFSSRNVVSCLREGARRFGWQPRDPAPGARRDGRWLTGTGVALSTYPSTQRPGSSAAIRVGPDGRYTVSIAAVDIGTGAWTALAQIAADALGVPLDRVELQIGDSALPPAVAAGGSAGTSSWGASIVAAADRLLARLEGQPSGKVPAEGVEVTALMPDNPDAARYTMHTFGAQFAEVRVDEETGEVRVPRLTGVFDAGRIINSKTARSQLIGGMTQGLSLALYEHSVADPRFGHVINHDFAGYHIATNADIGSIEAHFLDGDDPHTNPMGSKGIGEVPCVGTAAAIASAVYHATGVRVRDLPITLDKLL
jgi:xanthine dehydrogenase YagR molybdenum-binding subunit